MFMFGFTDSTCSPCCQVPCQTFNDPLTVRVGVLVSWENNTPGYDLFLNAITLSANEGIVVDIVLIEGVEYVLVEYEDSGTQYAYIARANVSKEIDAWWHICSGTWSINSVGGILSSNSSGVMTFLVTDPDTPYGIFTAEIEAIEDVIYYFYVKRGTDEDDECGTPDITISYEYKGTDWEIGVTGETPFNAFSPSSTVRVGVCVDATGVTVIFNGARVFQKCSVPSGYYFSIGASAAGTEWQDFRYSDHYDSNPNCPLCEPSKCFSDFNRTISGFDIEITGITNGNDCGCPSTISEFVPFDETNLGICGFSNTGEVTVSEFSGGLAYCQSATLSVSLTCSAGGPIILGVSLDHPGLTGNEWSESFSHGEEPENIEVENLAIDSADQGFACDYSSATLTATPRIVSGCCGGNPLP